MSVKHRLAAVPGCPPVAGCPAYHFPTEVVSVEGPLMTKVSKSNLNWQMLVLTGQILTAQLPDSEPPDSK